MYASTTANMTVDYVGVNVYVDQYNEETGKWEESLRGMQRMKTRIT